MAPTFSEFGFDVAIDGPSEAEVFIVGAPNELDLTRGFDFNPGAAYVFGFCTLPGQPADCNFNFQDDLEEIVFGSTPDCNNNFIPDICDILCGRSADENVNFIPDECEPDCPGDTNGDFLVNFLDLVDVLLAFNTNVPPGTGPDVAGNDGVVNFNDLVLVLLNFGDDCI